MPLRYSRNQSDPQPPLERSPNAQISAKPNLLPRTRLRPPAKLLAVSADVSPAPLHPSPGRKYIMLSALKCSTLVRNWLTLIGRRTSVFTGAIATTTEGLEPDPPGSADRPPAPELEFRFWPEFGEPERKLKGRERPGGGTGTGEERRRHAVSPEDRRKW